jgi:hypothetical protein
VSLESIEAFCVDVSRSVRLGTIPAPEPVRLRPLRDPVVQLGFDFHRHARNVEEGFIGRTEAPRTARDWGKLTFCLVLIGTILAVLTFFGKAGLYATHKQSSPF